MSLALAIETLFNSKQDSDVTFIVDKKELQAHQIVLIARSPVFKAMFKGSKPFQRFVISDPRFTYEDFNNFLKFLYTDKCEINAENVEVLLHLSHTYDVLLLFQTCVNQLPKICRQSNPFKFLEIGLLYNNKCDIVNKCLKEVPNYASKSSLAYLNHHRKWIWISAELVLEIVKNCPRTETFNENVVFQRVFDWVKSQCVNYNHEINVHHLKELMAPFVPYIRFEKMDKKILASTVYKYKLIPDERLSKCFRDPIVQKEDAPKSALLSVKPEKTANFVSRYFTNVFSRKK